MGDVVDRGELFPIQRSDGFDRGSVPWWVAEIAYADYSRRYGTDQSLKRLAERGGFGWSELGVHLASELERRGRAYLAITAQPASDASREALWLEYVALIDPCLGYSLRGLTESADYKRLRAALGLDDSNRPVNASAGTKGGRDGDAG